MVFCCSRCVALFSVLQHIAQVGVRCRCLCCYVCDYTGGRSLWGYDVGDYAVMCEICWVVLCCSRRSALWGVLQQIAQVGVYEGERYVMLLYGICFVVFCSQAGCTGGWALQRFAYGLAFFLTIDHSK